MGKWPLISWSSDCSCLHYSYLWPSRCYFYIKYVLCMELDHLNTATWSTGSSLMVASLCLCVSVFGYHSLVCSPVCVYACLSVCLWCVCVCACVQAHTRIPGSWLTHSLTHSITQSLNRSSIHRLTHPSTDWLTEWLTDSWHKVRCFSIKNMSITW